MATAAYIRNFLRELKHPSGKPRFQMLDGGEKAEQCLPVVAARLNPDLHLHYDDIDFQHALSETYVITHSTRTSKKARRLPLLFFLSDNLFFRHLTVIGM
jgi:hypothetical protein